MKAHLRASCRLVMKPIIRMLLQNGVTYKAFAQLIKALFVEAAENDYGINGRPTNITRIAILTGLDRKAIKQVKDERLGEEEKKPEESTDRITRVLSGWHIDTDFVDDQQQPRALSLLDDAPNLRTLLLRYGGDVQPTAMLKELKRLNLVTEVEKNRWRAKARSYIYPGVSPQAISRSFLGISDVAANMHHNLYIANEKIPKRFERRVTSVNFPQALVPDFHDFVHSEGQHFLEHLDAWLSAREIDPNTHTHQPLVRVGLGMYWVESA
ncbi:MAG: hypothetical protein KTR20_13870 [Cellvibrionaceae bacterium]|nr:hypothetical protein [Cellvibrionaceae bacterium]